MVRRVNLLANGFIQCSQQALARGEAVNGDVLHAVRDPDIHHRRRSCSPNQAKRGGWPSRGRSRTDGSRDWMGEGKAVSAQRVREAGRVEVQAQTVGFCPPPSFKVFRLDFITRDRLVGFQINRVQVQALRTGIRLSASVRSARSSVALRAFPG
jgi:hypothetical protein